MSSPDPLPQPSAEIAALLSKLHTGLVGQAMSIASVPTTWRIIHFAVQAPSSRKDVADDEADAEPDPKKAKAAYFNGVPEAVDFGSLWLNERRWVPGYRTGVFRQIFIEELRTLYKDSQTKRKTGRERVAAAAQFLLRNLTGDSLLALRQCLFRIPLSTYANDVPWWRVTPVPSLSNAELGRAYDSNKRLIADINLVALAQKIVSSFRPEVNQALVNFCNFDGAAAIAKPVAHRAGGLGSERDEAEDEDLEDIDLSSIPDEYAPFFRIQGTHKLRPATQDYLSLRVRPKVAMSLMDLPWVDQKNPAAVVAYFHKHLGHSILHASHFVLADVQAELIGELTMAGYPLEVLPVEKITSGEASAKPPFGRRDGFKTGEILALKRELERLARPAIQAALSPECKRPTDVIDGTAAKTGALGFEHISGIYLSGWTERAKELHGKPEAVAYSLGRPIAPDDPECFDALLGIFDDLKHMIFMRNMGLACVNAKTFCDKNPYMRQSGRQKVVSSMVKEILLACIHKFMPEQNFRFSTYANTTIARTLLRLSQSEVQILSFSDDDNSALSDVNTLAKESALERDHPDFCADIAKRFNAKKKLQGRPPMTPDRVQSLLAAGQIMALSGPVDDEGEPKELQLSANLHPFAPGSSQLDASQFAQVSEVVEQVLATRFTPGQEFDLSMLHGASPRPKAMKRLISHMMQETREKGRQEIAKAAKRNGGKVALAPGHLSEQSIRSTVGDEQARNESRGKGDGDADAGM